MYKGRNLFQFLFVFLSFERNEVIKKDSLPVTLLKYFKKIKSVLIVSLIFKYSLKDAVTIFQSI